MGKSEDKSEDSDEKLNSNKEDAEKKPQIEKEGEETAKEKSEPTPKTEDKPKESEEVKKNADDLRKVIKVGTDEEKKVEKKQDTKEINDDSDSNTRDSLEQKRAILQSIKDFDFQIKKNSEEISGINQKLELLSKDLDDLVSLYEIVSEQMNPFVGLSKVTKKRIDALENFTKEIEFLKERTSELESFAERSGARLKSLGEGEYPKAKTIDTDNILGNGTAEVPEKDNQETESQGEISDKADDNLETPIETQEKDEDNQSPTNLVETSEEITNVNTQEENQQPFQDNIIYDNIWDNFSSDELDIIIERTLGGLSTEEKIDNIIDEFIESLKG
ncbi:hypothetical protein AYK24_01945 [Thermoplasmatales archaeon SG8-52-4]|nr:MAG: hypothetical protein AYK24_01945 [Thermoplasmatales archaeon SG8-52-4]